MDPGVASIIAGLGVAVITAVGSPVVASQVKKREERDPTKGWQAAFTFMQRRIDELDGEVKTLRTDVAQLESDLDAKNKTIARQEHVIEEQTRAIMARDHRISQLESAWPNGITLPQPDPAYRNLLGIT